MPKVAGRLAVSRQVTAGAAWLSWYGRSAWFARRVRSFVGGGCGPATGSHVVARLRLRIGHLARLLFVLSFLRSRRLPLTVYQDQNVEQEENDEEDHDKEHEPGRPREFDTIRWIIAADRPFESKQRMRGHTEIQDRRPLKPLIPLNPHTNPEADRVSTLGRFCTYHYEDRGQQTRSHIEWRTF
jgi:hypothetical protein